MSVSYRDIEEQESSAQENPLRDMFAIASSKVLNSAELEYEESQPSTRWQLPSINALEVYVDTSAFHLIAATRISIKESMSKIQENYDCVQSIPLLNPKQLQAEAKRLKTQYLHLGCTRTGIHALTHQGLNTCVLATVQDLTHNKHTDSLIGGIVAPISNGPVYFDCYPNFLVYVFDEIIESILQLQIQTTGFDMNKKRHNIAIQTRGCFKHTNTLYPPIMHAPSENSKASVVVLTDPRNQKIEHQTIRWEDLTFPKHWVVSNPKPSQSRKLLLQISEKSPPLPSYLSSTDLL